MGNDLVSSRYALALFELAKREGRLEQAAAELGRLAGLIREHAPLHQLLLNPGIEVEQKVLVLDRLLQGAWGKDVRAFVQMVLAMGRAARLPEIGDAFQELVDDEQHILRATVRTARPLATALKTRLTTWLEQRGRATVTLQEEVDPQLLGGIQIFLGHRVVDGSLRTQLDALRHRMKSVRVY